MTEKLLRVSEMNASDIMEQFVVINKKITELAAHVKPSDSITLLCPKQMIDWLGITHPTLSDWAKKGIINRMKLGNRSYYVKEEVIASLRGTKYADKL